MKGTPIIGAILNTMDLSGVFSDAAMRRLLFFLDEVLHLKNSEIKVDLEAKRIYIRSFDRSNKPIKVKIKKQYLDLLHSWLDTEFVVEFRDE